MCLLNSEAESFESDRELLVAFSAIVLQGIRSTSGYVNKEPPVRVKKVPLVRYLSRQPHQDLSLKPCKSVSDLVEELRDTRSKIEICLSCFPSKLADTDPVSCPHFLWYVTEVNAIRVEVRTALQSLTWAPSLTILTLTMGDWSMIEPPHWQEIANMSYLTGCKC